MSQDTWNPSQYDRYKAERSQPFYDLMNLLEPTMNSHIVDLGCGTGELTSELHHHMHAAETLGIDSSAQMLAESKKYEGPNIKFLNSDISNWPQLSLQDSDGSQLSNSQYDIIFSNAAIQWCANHEAIFSNIVKSLKPHGQLAIQMPMNHDYPTHVIAYQLSQQQPWAKLLNNETRSQSNMLKAEDYATLLFKLGFKKQRVFTQVYSHVLDSRDDVIEWVKGTLLTYYKSRLTAEKYEDFFTEFKSRLYKQIPDEKPFFYPFKRILLWARL